MKSPACGEEVTSEWLGCVLSQHESRTHPRTSVTVAAFSVEPGVKPGENFGSQLIKISVTATLSQSGGSQQDVAKEYKLVVKFMLGNAFSREIVRYTRGMQREVAMYSKVLPALSEFVGGREELVLSVPQFVHGVSQFAEDVLVMEDIRPGGYVNMDKRAGLDLPHVLLAINRLARLHAVSLAYHINHDFINNFPEFKNIFSPDMFQMFSIMFYDFLIDFTKSRDIKLHEKLQQKRAKVKAMMGSLVDPQKQRLLCLCHGDYWSNNFMFKDDDADPIKVLDWGNVAWGNPALELQYLLHSSTTLAFRRAHTQEVLQRYFQTFTQVLDALGVSSPPWTFEDLQEELHRTRIFGIVMGSAVCILSLGNVAEKMTVERDAANAVDSSSYGWWIGTHLGWLTAPFFTSRLMLPLMNLGLRAVFRPFGEELAEGTSEIKTARVQELLDEAEEGGVFDI